MSSAGETQAVRAGVNLQRRSADIDSDDLQPVTLGTKHDLQARQDFLVANSLGRQPERVRPRR